MVLHKRMIYKISVILLLISLSAIFNTTYCSAAETEKIKTIDKLQEEVLDRLEKREESFNLKFKGKASELTQDTLDKMLDNIMKDLYLKNSVDTWSYEVAGISGSVNIKFGIIYRTSYTQELSIENRISTILSDIIQPDMNTFQKVKSINDYIVLNSKYSLDTVNSPYSPYTLLSEGKGVCSAYALLAYKMYQKVGIESYIVEGKTDIAHAWNIVRIGNNYYHVDTTWNDPLEDRAGLVQYTYFLVSDNDMLKTHTWNTNLYPKATDDSYNWMHSLRETYTKENTIYYLTQDGVEKSVTYTVYPEQQTIEETNIGNIEVNSSGVDSELKDEELSMISKITKYIMNLFNTIFN
ncbi:transglutaminase domain-containing protein [Clostridium tertium]|uniref:transglutaminase domain-containing protein n=1 Tax=Clostridium tertium TaxID=1559 RepID=UPI0023B22A74|nr:transglutaminase domain-containing protein [Clostridium tertium]